MFGKSMNSNTFLFQNKGTESIITEIVKLKPDMVLVDNSSMNKEISDLFNKVMIELPNLTVIQTYQLNPEGGRNTTMPIELLRDPAFLIVRREVDNLLTISTPLFVHRFTLLSDGRIVEERR